jgi:membrane associated rhomboid family serine protease
MEDSRNFKFTNRVIIVPICAIVLIWMVYWVEITFNYNFNNYGILPQKIRGLKGVFFSPFIHGSTSHLFNNSVPLFVLLGFLFFFYRRVAFKVLVVGTILTGILTWTYARNSYHIGASGVIYLLFSFIFFSGILRKHYRLVALSLIVVFLYGGLIWYVFPIDDGVSWEGHLSGFLTGLMLTFLYRNKGPQKREFNYEKTEFDLMFDEDGNYNPPALEEMEEEQ